MISKNDGTQTVADQLPGANAGEMATDTSVEDAMICIVCGDELDVPDRYPTDEADEADFAAYAAEAAAAHPGCWATFPSDKAPGRVSE